MFIEELDAKLRRHQRFNPANVRYRTTLLGLSCLSDGTKQFGCDTPSVPARTHRMMKLYVMQGACSLASHIALIWAKAPHELQILSHADVHEKAFLEINPKGAVPVLMIDDGSVLTESLAILQFIAESFPRSHLGAPTGDPFSRAILNESLAEMVSDTHKAWAPVFVPSRFVTQPAHEEDARQAAFQQLDIQYARLDRTMHGKTWRLFDRRTVADAYLYVMCTWKDQTPTPLASFPALAAFRTRLERDPDVLRAIREEEVTGSSTAQG
jgi:glutathione S-transferase